MVGERWSSRIERAESLDRWSERLAGVLAPLGRSGAIRDALSGTWLGHPLHPALVAVPIGAWLSASALDVLGGPAARPAARRLIALGIVGAVPAAGSGASDWLDTTGAERRVGAVHAASNAAATLAMTASYLARRRGRHGRGAALAAAGSAAAGLGGWLGGHLAYRLGVGVNTTAFQSGPTRWAPIVPEADVRVGEAVGVVRDTTAFVVVGDGDGTAHVLEDRCTHRGGPLHQGEVDGGYITCPWHGSVFALADGAVRRGPATMPQPAYRTRRRAGLVEIERDEPSSLRANPQGAERDLPPSPG